MKKKKKNNEEKNVRVVKIVSEILNGNGKPWKCVCDTALNTWMIRHVASQHYQNKTLRSYRLCMRMVNEQHESYTHNTQIFMSDITMMFGS